MENRSEQTKKKVIGIVTIVVRVFRTDFESDAAPGVATTRPQSVLAKREVNRKLPYVYINTINTMSAKYIRKMCYIYNGIQ